MHNNLVLESFAFSKKTKSIKLKDFQYAGTYENLSLLKEDYFSHLPEYYKIQNKEEKKI